MLRKLLIAFIFVNCLLPFAYSQAPVSWTSADMYLALRKLNVLGSVLYVAAHPDDDNARLIAYFSKETLYRTGYLSLTRGDGGQNLIGDEQGLELGLIRTQELLASRKVDGGEQFFSRAYDFGYSKNPEETFTKWDREKILSDVVWVIRKFQPDVVITRFPTTGEGGHGHHTASAILANEAYTAAADPNRFPEQLKYVNVWQVKRILWNTFNFGGTNTTSNDQFKLDDGGYNPLLGKSYGEIGATSRSQNRTQGTGSTSFIGSAIEYFRTTKGDPPTNDLMDGVDVTWRRIKGGEAIEKMVNDLITSFDLLHPANSVKGLVKLYQAIAQLPDGYWETQKLKETQQLIEQCSGLFIDATSNQQFAVQTDSVRINFSFNNRLGVNAMLKKINVDAFDTSLSQTLAKNVNLNFGKFFFVSDSKPVTQPYWLANKMEEGYYNVKDQQKIGQADVDPAYTANITVNIEGQDFVFPKAVKYKFTDPVRGELYEPLVVLPIISMKSVPELTIAKVPGDSLVNYDLRLTSNKNTGNIKIVEKYRFERDVKEIYNGSLMKGEVRTIAQTNVFGEKLPGAVRKQYLNDLSSDKERGSVINDTVWFYYNEKGVNDLHRIVYDHIPYQTYFTDTKEVRSFLAIKTVGKKIGYIIGAGDKVPGALEQMGYDVTILDEKSFARNNLQQYDAIVAGVRAYNTDPWLPNYFDKLMKYVNEGGNLIVQYNRNTNAGPLPKIGPYKFDISGNRITDENAEVKFSNPNHSVLHYPNEITQEDFKGWTQERSIYHATNFDKNNFETVFSMHDPGENDDAGSLIIGKYGKGTFVYTGLVFFRELPAGVPGAYRLMANLIALNKQKAF
jgi:LmbE family N-acetylglucosaminyl deacetylase